jgi:hypothetical protein
MHIRLFLITYLTEGQVYSICNMKNIRHPVNEVKIIQKHFWMNGWKKLVDKFSTNQSMHSK